MDPNIKTFVLLNAGILFGLFLYMMRNSGGRRSKMVMKLTTEKKEANLSKTGSALEVDLEPAPQAKPASSTEKAKPLNVIFTWNAHDWDAYEVLGIPAGSPMDVVTQAYDKALANVDDESKEFIHKAYRSICDS